MKHLKTYESFGTVHNAAYRKVSTMNKSTCDRCGESTDGVTTMSMFNEDVICMTCKQNEKNDPEYGAAAATENEEVQKGNTNYKGAIPNYKPIKNTSNTQS